jgi:hypothetical protein
MGGEEEEKEMRVGYAVVHDAARMSTGCVYRCGVVYVRGPKALRRLKTFWN